jgi:cobalt-zinc-cadmium efflux system membrane fusion protein
MRNKLLNGIVAIAIFIGLSVLFTGLITRGNLWAATQESEGAAGHDDHSGHNHGDQTAEDGKHNHSDSEDSHDHEGSTNAEECDDHCQDDIALPSDKKALLAVSCEHGTPIVKCGECRYEVGVAKIEPALSKGLLETQVVEAAKSVETMLNLTGEVQLDLARVVEVASVGSGRVERLDKILGDRVEVSTPLAIIQSSEFGQAQAEFLALKAKLNLARATFEREDKLYKQKITSEADSMAASNVFKSAQASLVAAEKKLQLFGLSEEQVAAFALEQTNGTFGQLVLTAPIDGIVTKQNIVRGRLVRPTDTLYTIADLSHVWVWCDVYERDLAALYQQVAGDEPVTAKIRVAAFPNEIFEGTVDMIGNEVDQYTRTTKVRVIAENAETKLKPGMFADVQIVLSRDQSAIRVPETAVLSDSAERFVFELLEDDLWIRRDVVVGEAGDGLVAVMSGLEPGATIAAKGGFMFKSEVLKQKMGAGCAH